MSMDLSGSGTIIGLQAGGLPSNSVLTADIADANITATKLDGAQSGSAPVYGVRAWVLFNGATGAIRASGNVTSVTRNGTGDYTVNFTIALPDANYGFALSAGDSSAGCDTYASGPNATPTTTAFRFQVRNDGTALSDRAYVSAIFIR